MDKDNSLYTNTTSDRGTFVTYRSTWKDAFACKAVSFSPPLLGDNVTKGYRIMWVLWSADIWFGKFPLLKFILAVNVVVWILQFIL